MTIGSCTRDTECHCRFLVRKTGEIPQLDQLGFFRRFFSEFYDRFLKDQKLIGAIICDELLSSGTSGFTITGKSTPYLNNIPILVE